MFIDALNLLSDAQALSATGFTTNTIDLGNITPKRDIAVGEPMCIAYHVEVTAAAGGTFVFEFVQSANADLSSPDVLATMTVVAATLVAGYKFYLPLPSQAITKRYIGGRYTLGGTTPTITVSAEVQPLSMVQNDKTYAKGYTIQ